MTAPALLVAEDLDKEYRSGPELVRVLRGASLALRQGEMVALVGASGVGKSTLLHLLGALDRPTAGRVLWEGEDLFGRPESGLVRYRRHEVGFVFQFYNLLGEMSALENAMIPALLVRRPAQEARELAASATGRASCRVASSSGSRSPAPWSMPPSSSWRTSPLATSTRRRARSSTTCSSGSRRSGGSRSSSRRTTPIWRVGPSAATVWSREGRGRSSKGFADLLA